MTNESGGHRRVIFEVQPNAAALFDASENTVKFSISFWRYWLRIADDHAAFAATYRQPDDVIDAMSSALAGDPRPHVPHNLIGSEIQAAMVAVTAAAHAIDGFYGSALQVIDAPHFAQRTARYRRIVEALKRGFDVGSRATRWREDLKWLFGSRDRAVHHSDEWQEGVATRITDETVVVGGPESFGFSADSARRAADIAADVVMTCLEHPKPPVREWAAWRRADDRDNDADDEA